jgi:hypothetical protein
MSNARTRRNRREGIAAKAQEAFAIDAQWRSNPLMAQPIRSNKSRFTRTNDSAYQWDGHNWVADEARERKIVRTEFDTPLLPEVAQARADGMKGVRWIDNDGGVTVTRTTDDIAMRAKPNKRQQRGSGQDVETWASKKD